MLKHSYFFLATAACLVIANLVTTSALKGGFEYVHTYDYEAKINVGVEGYISQFHIDGLLKIQRDGKYNNYRISLSDLKQEYYYGEENQKWDRESTSIKNNILQSPFYAIYDDVGQLKSIEYSKNETAWSKKIKKSIGHLFEFNSAIVQRGISSKEVLSRDDAEEITNHGNCKVYYNMVVMNLYSKLNESFMFTRTYTPNLCDGLTHNISGYVTNNKITKTSIADKIDFSTIRTTYKLDIRNDEDFTIKSISNFESYKYTDDIDNVAFIRDNRQLIVEVRQSLTLKDINLDEKLPKILNRDSTFSSSYDYNNQNITDKVITHDRIKELLLKAFDYTEENKLKKIDPETVQLQLFNKILASLASLNTTEFATLHEDPSIAKMRNIFISIVPYVGTKASLTFLTNAISEKNISDDLAVNVLIILPTYVEQPVEALSILETLVNQHIGLELSANVYESAVLSFSHLLNKALENSDNLDDSSLERYLLDFVRGFKAAETIASKLVFLTAIGNVRSHASKKYILPILLRQNDNVEDQDRVRLVAINILSELVTEADIDVFERILYDKSESRSIRLAAYDVLVSKNNLAADKLIDIGRMVSDDKNLYNYHLSTVEGLQQVGLLSPFAKIRMNTSDNTVSSSLSRVLILKTDNLMKSDLLKSKFRVQPQTYVKLSFILEDQSFNSNWQIPSVMKFEILEKNKANKLTTCKIFYFYTNFNGVDLDKDVFFDYLIGFNQNSRIYYIDSIKFKGLPNLLELSDQILHRINEKSTFAYSELTRFSLETGLGVDAVFEHKYPSLVSMTVDYNWKLEDNSLEARVDLFLKEWSNGYSGVSLHNPLSGLTHSLRKVEQVDATAPLNLIVKYNFSKNQLNVTVPIILKDPKSEIGLAVYTSTSVAITDEIGDISCQNCGYKYTTSNPKSGTNSLILYKSDFLGIFGSQLTYDCDPERSLNIQDLASSTESNNIVNTCGFLAHVNLPRDVSQIELLMNFDYELSKSWEKPWYFLPGYKINFESSLRSRQAISNKINYLIKLDFNISTSQGYFSNLLQFKVVKRNDEGSNFILCFDGKTDFPEIADNHLPFDVTKAKLNTFSRVVMGQSNDESCSKVDFKLDFDLIGEVSDEQRNLLENYASDSQCAKQKSNPLYVHPKGLYPLTEDCVREMISNTTFRRYKLNLSSDKFSELSLLQLLLVIKNTQSKLQEMAANSNNAYIEIKMISPLTEIRTTKRMSFQTDYSVSNIYRNLPNVFFPQSFVLGFIDKKIIVINVYPKMIFYNNEEKPFPDSTDWNEIYTGIEKLPYKIYAKLMDDDKLILKIWYNNYELLLKPKLISEGTKGVNDLVYVPEAYYNEQLSDNFNQRLHLFSSEVILFSLSKVDDYMVVHSTEIPVTIYYTVNSITIFQKT